MHNKNILLSWREKNWSMRMWSFTIAYYTHFTLSLSMYLHLYIHIYVSINDLMPVGGLSWHRLEAWADTVAQRRLSRPVNLLLEPAFPSFARLMQSCWWYKTCRCNTPHNITLCIDTMCLVIVNIVWWWWCI